MAKNIFRPKANFLLLSILEPPFFCVMQARPSRTKQLRGSFSFKHKVIQTLIGSPQSSSWWPLDIWLETSQVRPRKSHQPARGWRSAGKGGKAGEGGGGVRTLFLPFHARKFYLSGWTYFRAISSKYWTVPVWSFLHVGIPRKTCTSGLAMETTAQ